MILVEERRPYYRRFARIEQEIVWAAIQSLDIADKVVVLRELATEVAAQGLKRGNEYDNVRAGVISLRDAADVLGQSPSLYEYRQLREHSPELGLASDTNIRRWLGGTWNDCLRRALLDAVSEGDFVTRAVTGGFTEEELVASIREYMADHDGRVPTWPHYVAWARSPIVRERPGRRPLSHTPFSRLGGYREILLRNELVSAREMRLDGRGRVLPLKWRFNDDELRAAVTKVAEELARPPRETEYRRAREKSDALIPSVSTLTNRFGGSWRSVLESIFGSGASEVGGPIAAARGKTSPYTDEEMTEAVRRGWYDVGEPLSKNAYRTWRRAKLKEASDAGDETRIPNAEVIARRFGGWPEAIEAALPRGVRIHRRRKTYDND